MKRIKEMYTYNVKVVLPEDEFVTSKIVKTFVRPSNMRRDLMEEKTGGTVISYSLETVQTVKIVLNDDDLLKYATLEVINTEKTEDMSTENEKWG